MGGFFGITSRRDCLADVFFGVDYHTHLGTRRGGLAAYDPGIGLQRQIHNIENSPFRTKFEHVLEEMRGCSAIGCISDTDPQPLLVRSRLGAYALAMVGIINNSEELIDKYLSQTGCFFETMTGGRVNNIDLVSALINQKDSFAEGIRFANEVIDGTASILVLCDNGHLIAARDRLGRLPIELGRREDGYAVSFEPFAYQKLGFEDERSLGPGEIVEITPEGVTQLSPPGDRKRICAFLWSYYGYPSSTYEGVNVEAMRYRNGAIMAINDRLSRPGETEQAVPAASFLSGMRPDFLFRFSGTSGMIGTGKNPAPDCGQNRGKLTGGRHAAYAVFNLCKDRPVHFRRRICYAVHD